MRRSDRPADNGGMGYLPRGAAAPVLTQSRNGSGSPGRLSHEDLRAAELGFRQLLRRKRFPAAFLSRHAADLLAQARLEYVRHFAGGDEIDNAPGWIIHCAWRRTQNLLERESRASRAISAKNGGDLGVELTTPEDEVLEADRHRKVQEAIGKLTLEERRVIALTYFEGLSVREASRTLGWDKSKGDRRHNSALAHLYEHLGVKDADSLQIEAGAAAWASLAAGKRIGLHLPAAVHAALDTAGRGAVEFFGRAQELARRVLPGGAADGGIGAAAGARAAEMGGGGILAACTVGVCGAAAVTCFATGVLGPGLGGGHSKPEEPAAERSAAQLPGQLPAPAIAPREHPLFSKSPNRGKSANRPAKPLGARQRASVERVAAPSPSPTPSPPREIPQQADEEFDPLEGGGESSPESSPTSSGRALGRPTDSDSAPPPPPARAKQVEAEFGF